MRWVVGSSVRIHAGIDPADVLIRPSSTCSNVGACNNKQSVQPAFHGPSK